MIVGSSGCGKSSFLAHIVGTTNHPSFGQSHRAFFHFCGANVGAQHLPDMLERLYAEFRIWVMSDLHTLFSGLSVSVVIDIKALLPDEVKELNHVFSIIDKVLFTIETETSKLDAKEQAPIVMSFKKTIPIVIFVLDAVNQLNDERYSDDEFNPSSMRWLPLRFESSHLRVILSCLPDCEALHSLTCEPSLLETQDQDGVLFPYLRPQYAIIPYMIGDLNQSQRKQLVYKWHRKFHKEVEEYKFLDKEKKEKVDVVKRLWTADQCKNTLFLSLAVNYLITHGTYQTVVLDGSLISYMLDAKTVPELIARLLRKNVEAIECEGKLPSDLLQKVMCFIYCSLEGLTIKELMELTGCRDQQFWSLFAIRYQQLVTIEFGLVNFAHAFVKEAIEMEFLNDSCTIASASASASAAPVSAPSVSATAIATATFSTSDSFISASSTLPSVIEGVKMPVVQKSVKFDALSLHKQLAKLFMKKVESAEKTEVTDDTTREMRELDYHERKCKLRPSVIVAVRIRPRNEKEIADESEQTIVSVQGKTILIENPEYGNFKPFPFTMVLPSSTSQQRVFQLCGKDITQQVLQGYNVAVVAYGQTSSGKTHTMFGTDSDRGLIPRSIGNLLLELNHEHRRHGWEWQATCSIVEVYMENVYDLLRETQIYSNGTVVERDSENIEERIGRSSASIKKDFALHVRLKAPISTSASASASASADKNDSILVPSGVQLTMHNFHSRETKDKSVSDSSSSASSSLLISHPIKTVNDLQSLITRAQLRRETKSTDMNHQSSRSHCVVIVSVERTHASSGEKRSSTVHLVDLAGSERLSRLGVDPDPAKELERNQETKATNKSLFVLNKCIKALSTKPVHGKVPYIPYRESMLTTVLQESLGGDAKLVLISTVAPTASHYFETDSTLRFSAIAKDIAKHKNTIALQLEAERKRRASNSNGGGGSSEAAKAAIHLKMEEDGVDAVVALKYPGEGKEKIDGGDGDDEEEDEDGKNSSYGLRQGTLLHWALLEGLVPLVTSLLEQGADKESLAVPTSEGGSEIEGESVVVKRFPFSPLMTAVVCRLEGGIRALVSKGASIDARPSLCTALALACERTNVSIVFVLLELGAKADLLDENGASPLMYACRGGQTDIAALLIDKGADVNILDKNNFSPLMAASSKGHSSTVAFLLSKHAHADAVSNDSNTPLHLASAGGYSDIVMQLLSHGADVLAKDSMGRAALQLALEKGHADCASLLQTNARDDDRNTRNTPLHTAAEGGDLARVSQLIDAGAVLDANSNKGYTALELAVEKGHASVAALLRSKGARDPEERDSDRQTPLMNASWKGDSARVAHLLSQGADPSTRNEYGGTSLHWASYKGRMGVVKVLLARGVPINSRGKDGGRTPLGYATRSGHTAVAELLRSKGGIE